MKDKTCERIDTHNDGGLPRQCRSRGEWEYQDRWYCETHDPDPKRCQERRDIEDAKRKAHYTAYAKYHNRATLCVSVLKDFSDSALSSGVVGEMVEGWKLILGWSKEGLECTYPPHIVKIIEKAESILSKLEADNG